MQPRHEQIQSRRDSEIVRIKKHYLALFLQEANSNPSLLTSKIGSSSDVVPVSPGSTVTRNHCKRKMQPRPIYPKNAPKHWREACVAARHVNDVNLPSLEEAAQLFGFCVH
eukprot:CAMPEP_0202474586 /NCGR_PEP_ID=MMETSP1360-20130828/92464_1 /ASSEMBLY_ACC=CAM_ASM_000848 /TAXON_ID=515479 /ORGANISM="Licmophora paradoxa, Strain CCMP2313" /LENGTH=110 /DNA_ID=CAMNT_0049101723 /DNA_START=1282 /DNA_END=1614 /DNA_ORIENTATION=-